MTFGIIKTIIEDTILESYKDEKSFKRAINEFRQNVLNNKNLSKVYALYDELSKPQGLSESDAKEFVQEGITLIQKLLENIKLPKVMRESQVENKYSLIDELVYSPSKIDLLKRVNAKKEIYKTLQESVQPKTSNVALPISSMVKIANQTIHNYLENIDENTRKEFLELVKEDTKTLEVKFSEMKSIVLEKLNPLFISENDESVKEKLKETIQRIEKENFDQLNFIKLKKLKESL